MPTTQWIVDDAEDRIGEWTVGQDRQGLADRVGSAEPQKCPRCHERFFSDAELREHIRAHQSFHRPTLLINGRPASTDTVIRSRPFPAFEIVGATQVAVSRDGAPPRRVPGHEIPDMLASAAQAHFRIEFTDGYSSGRGTAPPVTVQVDIVPDAALDFVDDAFAAHLATGEISATGVDRFLETARTQGAAREYTAALAEYVSAILARDRSERSDGAEGRSREHLMHALGVLETYRRPWAQGASAVIRLCLNDFRSDPSSGGGEVNGCLTTLRALSRKERLPPVDVSPPSGRSFSCPVDEVTRQILDGWRWACGGGAGRSGFDTLGAAARASTVTEADRAKLWALAALGAQLRGDVTRQREAARNVSHDPVFGAWVNGLSSPSPGCDR